MYLLLGHGRAQIPHLLQVLFDMDGYIFIDLVIVAVPNIVTRSGRWLILRLVYYKHGKILPSITILRIPTQ